MHFIEREPKASIWPNVLLAFFVVMVGIAALGWRYGPVLSDFVHSSAPTNLREVKHRVGVYENEKLINELYNRAKLSVVNVTSLTVRRNFYSRNLERIPKGMGTGFVWDKEGRIVTNYHVVEGVREWLVTLDDRSEYKANLVGYSKAWDIAVLQIAAPDSKVHPLDIGESKDLFVGQSDYAIGNPFGLDQSLASGIISALNREIESRGGSTISGAIQTTAPINPGNSGGPLLDSEGRLIGVNTAIISPSGAWAGIGFAIPVDTVNEVVTAIINESTKKVD